MFRFFTLKADDIQKCPSGRIDSYTVRNSCMQLLAGVEIEIELIE